MGRPLHGPNTCAIGRHRGQGSREPLMGGEWVWFHQAGCWQSTQGVLLQAILVHLGPWCATEHVSGREGRHVTGPRCPGRDHGSRAKVAWKRWHGTGDSAR